LGEALPEINAAEIMIGAVVERRGYGRDGFGERMVEAPPPPVSAASSVSSGSERRERADSKLQRVAYEYGGFDNRAGEEGNGYAQSGRSSEVGTESERERSKDRVLRWA
jgi:hypothetical protein